MPFIQNVVTLVGNITRDPELRYTPAGKAVAGFGIAHNTRRKNPTSGEWEDGETSFFDVTCWDQLGENVAESIFKGTKVIVVGELRQESWTDVSGDKKSRVKVIASTVGPALDWATAEVVRNERTSDGPPRSDSPSGRSQGSVRRPQPVPEFSEEPF
jgi:single-strand DNA-binding protein